VPYAVEKQVHTKEVSKLENLYKAVDQEADQVALKNGPSDPTRSYVNLQTDNSGPSI
jgi:hypothetical protein